jgi:hypothetical protein
MQVTVVKGRWIIWGWHVYRPGDVVTLPIPMAQNLILQGFVQ